MPPAHINSAERRARRARRKKLRQRGRAMIAIGWIVVIVAAVVGVVGLKNVFDDPGGADDVSTGTTDPLSVTSTTRRERPSAVGTATGETLVVDLVPTTAPPNADGSPSATTVPQDAEGTTFGVRGPNGVVQVQAAPVGSRPNPNVAPTVTAPASVTRDANGNAFISGITVDDPDYPGAGDIGVALIGQGTITVTLNQDVVLLGRNSGPFVGLAGPPAALNRALANLQFHSAGADATPLLITVTDWAYGDISRSQSGYAATMVE
jgi:hypothetical protein